MHQIKSSSSLKLQVRKAEKDDLPALLVLENTCFKEESFHKKQLEYLLLRAKSIIFVAAVEGNIVASVIILLREHIDSARIYSLNVHPAYQRRGIGSLLMDKAIKFLKYRGFKKITLEAGVNNRAALNLYGSKGFFADKILRNYYKNGADALHFVKEL